MIRFVTTDLVQVAISAARNYYHSMIVLIHFYEACGQSRPIPSVNLRVQILYDTRPDGFNDGLHSVSDA